MAICADQKDLQPQTLLPGYRQNKKKVAACTRTTVVGCTFYATNSRHVNTEAREPTSFAVLLKKQCFNATPRTLPNNLQHAQSPQESREGRGTGMEVVPQSRGGTKNNPNKNSFGGLVIGGLLLVPLRFWQHLQGKHSQHRREGPNKQKS